MSWQQRLQFTVLSISISDVGNCPKGYRLKDGDIKGWGDEYFGADSEKENTNRFLRIRFYIIYNIYIFEIRLVNTNQFIVECLNLNC